jgi:toxin YoeB
MRLVFTPQGWDDYTHWQRVDRAVLKRINRLVEDALRDPTAGIGKPELLK